MDLRTLASEPAATLEMNDIATVEIETSKPLFFDPYERNRTTGSLVLIDLETNATVAAGMIVQARWRTRGQAHRPGHGRGTACALRPPARYISSVRGIPRHAARAPAVRPRLRGRRLPHPHRGRIARARNRRADRHRQRSEGPALPADDARAAEEIMRRLFENEQNYDDGGGI